MNAMDNELITDEWLVAVGFRPGTLSWSRLLEPQGGNGAIVELCLQPEDNNEYTVFLLQGLPHGDDQTEGEDHVTITSIYPKTRGEIIRLFAALGDPLPEVKVPA